MNSSTRRALRTGYHFVLALVAITPLLLLHVGTGGLLGALAGFLVLISKVVNSLEDAGAIPAWLKGNNDVAVTPPDVAPEEEATGHAHASTPVEPGDAAP